MTPQQDPTTAPPLWVDKSAASPQPRLQQQQGEDVETEDEDAFMSFDEGDSIEFSASEHLPSSYNSTTTTSKGKSTSFSIKNPFTSSSAPSVSPHNSLSSSPSTIRPSSFKSPRNKQSLESMSPSRLPLPTSPSHPQIPPLIHSTSDVPAFFASRPYITISVDDLRHKEERVDIDSGDESESDDESPNVLPPMRQGRRVELERDVVEVRNESTPLLAGTATATRERRRTYSGATSPGGSPLRSRSRSRRGGKRLPSLDIFRGGVVLAMIMANFQIPSHAFSWMLHAEWIGLSPVDLIFPAFLFAMGMSLPLSLHIRDRSYLSLAYRSTQLFLIGLLLNDPITPYVFTGSLSHFRILGVLQRIGIVYFVCAVAYKALPWLLFQILFPTTFLSFWFYLTLHTQPTAIDPSTNLTCRPGMLSPPECTAQSHYDILLLTSNHTYRNLPYDNEGTLSTITAALSCWAGVVLGVSLLRTMHPDLTDGGWRAKLLRGTGGSGVVAIALGIVVERFGMPISKILWTPSFLFIASGVGLLVFGMAFWSVDLEPEMAKRLLEVRKGWISRRRSGVLRSRPVSYVSDGGRSMSPDATVSPETSPPPARRRRHDKIPPLMMARFMVLHALIAVGRNPLLVYVVSSLIEVVLWWSVPGGIAPRYLAGILFEGCGFTVLPFGVSSLVWSAVWTVGVVVPMAVVLDARGVYWTV